MQENTYLLNQELRELLLKGLAAYEAERRIEMQGEERVELRDQP